MVEESIRQGIGTLTLFAFSSENWRRPQSEVSLLLELFLGTLRAELRRLADHGVRLKIIGERTAFPDKLQLQISEAEEFTADNDRLLLLIAANYGGRWDIAQAARRLGQMAADGRLAAEEIDEATLAAHLSFPEVIDPDLLIRTGGEQRLSNFLLWQCAYTELLFTDVMWPDFGVAAYRQALADYARRHRRFGLTGEQLTESPAETR